MIREFCNIIKESSHHIIFDSQLRHLVVCVLSALVSDHVLEDVCDCLPLLLIINGLCGKNARSIGSTSLSNSTSHTSNILGIGMRSSTHSHVIQAR